MLADFVEMSASAIAASGTGDITLAQVTGSQMGGSYTGGSRPKFSTVFGTNTRAVKYVIEDITTGAYERGIGIVNASGTDVLTRSVVRETWTGTGMVRVGATPIAFTASAQNVRVRIAPQSDDAKPAIPQMPSVYGAGNYGLISGNYCPYVGNYNTAPVINALETYMPFLWEGGSEIDQAGIYVTTAAASKGVKVGLFAMRPDGMPGACLFNTNANPLSAGATGFVSASMVASSPGANIRLAPGWYWFGYITTDNTINLAGPNPPYILNSPAGYSGSGAVANGVIYKSGGGNSYATGLPADASTAGSYGTLSNAYLAFLFLRPKLGA